MYTCMYSGIQVGCPKMFASQEENLHINFVHNRAMFKSSNMHTMEMHGQPTSRVCMW